MFPFAYIHQQTGQFAFLRAGQFTKPVGPCEPEMAIVLMLLFIEQACPTVKPDKRALMHTDFHAQGCPKANSKHEVLGALSCAAPKNRAS